MRSLCVFPHPAAAGLPRRDPQRPPLSLPGPLPCICPAIAEVLHPTEACLQDQGQAPCGHGRRPPCPEAATPRSSPRVTRGPLAEGRGRSPTQDSGTTAVLEGGGLGHCPGSCPGCREDPHVPSPKPEGAGRSIGNINHRDTWKQRPRRKGKALRFRTAMAPFPAV